MHKVQVKSEALEQNKLIEFQQKDFIDFILL